MDIERTRSACMAAVLDLARRFALAPDPVLILGETGTGKTDLAKYIHSLSGRRGAFVEINCGAIPDGLLESELFGHERGAFSGAVQLHKGRFEQAAGGTIFLDEIGEMPMAMQVKLLRVLEDKRGQRVGGTRDISYDARIICATHRDLYELQTRGSFREDLRYRVTVLDLCLPPLRDRRVDIPSILSSIEGLSEGAVKGFSEADYDWPGNVRQLLNTARKAALSEWGEDEVRSALAPLSRPLLDVARDDVILGLAARSGGVRAAEVQGALGVRRTQAFAALARMVQSGALERRGGACFVRPDSGRTPAGHTGGGS